MVDGTMDGPPQTETPSRCEGVSRYARRSVPDAREDHATVSGPASQPALAALLGAARLRTYASVTGGDLARAGDLYLWATQLAGALHAQLSFVEIAAARLPLPRNAGRVISGAVKERRTTMSWRN